MDNTPIREILHNDPERGVEIVEFLEAIMDCTKNKEVIDFIVNNGPDVLDRFYSGPLVGTIIDVSK